MKLALEAIRDGTSTNLAAKTFNIPLATLQRKHKLGESAMKNRGSTTVLTKEDETALVNWLKKCAERGCPRTLLQIREAARNIVVELSRPNQFVNQLPSAKWCRGFMKRHADDLRLRKPEALSQGSSTLRAEDLVCWWACINDYMAANQYLEILSDPSRVANCDESFVEYNPNPTKVVVAAKNQAYVAENGKSKAGCTVLHTVNIIQYIIAIIFAVIHCFTIG